jgi:hypothetical protein
VSLFLVVMVDAKSFSRLEVRDPRVRFASGISLSTLGVYQARPRAIFDRRLTF